MNLSPESNVSKSEAEKEPRIILHTCLKREWERAQESGEYRGEDFDSSGFIHCSTTEQIGKILDRIPEGEDFVVLKIDSNKVVPEIKYEKSGSGELYPHIYGPLNIDAVISVEDFRHEKP